MTKKTKDRIKSATKSFLLRTAIFLSASSGISGVTAAQNTQQDNNDNKKNEVQFEDAKPQYSKLKIGMDVPPIYGEKPLKLSRDQLWEIVVAAQLKENQLDAFIKNIVTLQNSPQGITDKNMPWIFGRSVELNEFTKQQCEVMVNKAFEMTIPKVTKEKEISSEDLSDIPLSENRFKVEGNFENSISDYSKSTHSTGGNHQESFSYSFIDGKLNIIYDGLIDIKNLQPNLYQKSDGTYRCGPNVGSSRQDVLLAEKQDLSRIAVKHMVYQDLTEREKNGEKLSNPEQKFMQSHNEELRKHGLSISPKGLQQQDRQIVMPQRSR